MGGLVASTQHGELDFCRELLKRRPVMITFVSTIMRNGTFEQEFLAATATNVLVKDVGEL